MSTARELMHPGVTCVREHEPVRSAARHMAANGVGALPICGDDGRLHGMITDRDIVVRCVARGLDPDITAVASIAQDTTYFVEADAGVEEILETMEKHRVRRLPVIDNHRLVGIIGEADLAQHLPEHSIAEFLKAICAPQAFSTH